MRLAYILLGAVFVALAIGFFMLSSREEEPAPGPEESEQMDTVINVEESDSMISLTSSVFEHGGTIPLRYTCDGEDMNPPLSISGVPENTQSLVLIMDDPDVPKNLRADGMWDHWVVFNMPPGTSVIEEGREPEGTAGNSSWKRTGYGGPCPPDREHRYFFKLYALDTMLGLEAGATKAEVERAMEGRIIEQAELMGRYNRVGNQ